MTPNTYNKLKLLRLDLERLNSQHVQKFYHKFLMTNKKIHNNSTTQKNLSTHKNNP